MTKINVSTLEGPLLAEFVARAQGWYKSIDNYGFSVWRDRGNCVTYGTKSYSPDINGGQCFELIEEFDIWLSSYSPCMDNVETNRSWIASTKTTHIADEEWMHGEGSTPEIAICRAVIASVYGEYVDI